MTPGKERQRDPHSWAAPSINPKSQVRIDAVEWWPGERFAVRVAGLCLSRPKQEFEYEPMHTQRSLEWLEDHKADYLEEALFERWLDSCDLEKRPYVPHSRPGPHGDLGYAPRVELKDRMQATQGAPRG